MISDILLSVKVPVVMFCPIQDGGNMFSRNVGTHPSGYTVSWCRTPQYCHVTEWLYTGFRLVIAFIAHLYTQLTITNNYSAIANSHNLQFTAARSKCSHSAVSSTVFRLVTAPNAVASSSSVSTSLLFHIKPPTPLAAVSRLSRNRSCSSLYSVGTDRPENTLPNSFSIVASRSYYTDLVENTASKLLHFCL
jgi:hypothetical protein